MTQKFVRVGLTALVLVSAFGGLLWYSLQQDTAYYKHVEEVMTSPTEWQGKALQLHGYVVPGSILRGTHDQLEWRFKVQSKGSMVDAAYRGIMPDTFKDEAEVVLKGRLTSAGFNVEPNGVMAKCPSKYEPKPGFVKPGTASSN